VEYTKNDGTKLESQSTQYRIKEGMDIKLTVTQAETVLTNGRIYCPWLGSPFGTHRTITKDGVAPNMAANALVDDPWHSTLPDVVLRVSAAAPDPDPGTNPGPEEPITPIPDPEEPIDEPAAPVTPAPKPDVEIDDSDAEAPAVVVPIDAENVTIDSDTGTATVAVPEGALTSLIEQAIETAGSREPTVEIRPPMPPAGEPGTEAVEIKEVKVEIPIGDLKAVAESEVENVKIASPVGEVTLNTDAIWDLLDLVAKTKTDAGNAPTVDIVVTKGEETIAKTEDLTEKQQETLRDDKTRDVFDVSIHVGSKRLEDFKTPTGKLTIGLPYELRPDEVGAGVGVHYIDKDGEPTPMVDGRRYDETKHLAVFQTDHLSIYAVVYDYAGEKEDGGSVGIDEDTKRGGGSGGGCDMGTSGLLALAGAALAVFRPRGRGGYTLERRKRGKR
jgi:hypothetical protein